MVTPNRSSGPLGPYSEKDAQLKRFKDYGISRNTVGPSSYRKRLLDFAAFRRDRGFTTDEYYDFVITKIPTKSRESVRNAVNFLLKEGWIVERTNGRYYITDAGKIAVANIGKRDASPLRDEDI